MTAIQEHNVPTLRFPEFSEDWNIDRLDNYISRVGVPVSIKPEKLYREIGIRSHAKGLFHKEPVTGKSLGNKRVFKVHIPAFVVNIVFAWEHAIAITSDNEEGFIASHRFPMFVPIDRKSTLPFVRYFFIRKYGKHLLGLASPGGAGRNKTLGQKDFAKLKVVFPEPTEQQKIASFLISVDTKIEQLVKKKYLLEKYKKSVMQKIFNQELRFKDEQGNDYPDWEKKKLGDFDDLIHGDGDWILSQDISKNGQYKIIQLGNIGLGSFVEKSFKTISKDKFEELNATIIKKNDLLINRMVDKNLYCCLLKKDGDFVTSVDVCWIRKNMFFDNYFLISLMLHTPNQHKLLRLSSGSGRVRISKKNLFNKFHFLLPKFQEQQKIANFLAAIDKKTDLINTELTQAQTFKKGLLQQMFV